MFLKELTRREREQLDREEAIAAKAEELFCIYGFDKVSMDDLAKKSEYTKRTIYRYFTNKEDLFFAVALKSYKRLFELMKARSRAGKTGLEKIRLSYNAYYEFFCKFPQMLQLMNMSGIIKSNSKDMDVPQRQKYMDFDKQVSEELLGAFIEGKSDGSIRSELDISSLAYSSIFIATGFFQLLSLTGDHYTKHFNLDINVFVKSTIDMLINSLRG